MKAKSLGKEKSHSSQSHFSVCCKADREQKPLRLGGSCKLLTLTAAWQGHAGISRGHLKGSDQQPALKHPTLELKCADYRLLWPVSLC